MAGPEGDVWVGLVEGRLPLEAVTDWVGHPSCGAKVVFTGSVRDHSPGRPGVIGLHYEAYDQWVGPRLEAAVTETRRRWPEVRRAAALHRRGTLSVGEDAVVVAVATAHRAEAFAAAHFLIDTVKATVPLWKHETWASGSDWSACDHQVVRR